MAKKKSPEKMTQAEFEAWRNEHGGWDWMKDWPTPDQYSSPEEYRKALQKWKSELKKIHTYDKKSRQVTKRPAEVHTKLIPLDQNGVETIQRIYSDGYQFHAIDVEEDPLLRYSSLEKKKKAIDSLLKPIRLTLDDEKQIDNRRAIAAARKLWKKNPKLTYKQVMQHPSIVPHLSRLTSDQHKWRILKQARSILL